MLQQFISSILYKLDILGHNKTRENEIKTLDLDKNQNQVLSCLLFMAKLERLSFIYCRRRTTFVYTSDPILKIYYATLM